MVRPIASFARAARWQQPLAIIVVLSSMLTTSTPAVPDDPPPDCVDVYTLIDEVPAQDIVGNGVTLIRLKPGKSRLTEAVRELTLCPREPESEPVYGVRFKVEASNVRLDCGGVVFDGRPFELNGAGVAVPVANWDEDWYKHREEIEDPETLWNGAVEFAINFLTPEVPPAIQDVVVRNCEFQNYPEGIVAAGAAIEENGLDLGLENITLQDIVLSKIWASAVTIGVDNRDNLLEGVDVADARTGVYLEAYSSRTTIRGCTFIHNGWSGPDGSDGREAIAIDGSSHNVITDNFFSDNKHAAINLYKNCGESADPNEPGDPREGGANYNTIERNEFYKHDNGVTDTQTRLIRGGAIVIASRQGLDFEDTQDAWGAGATCTDTPAHEDEISGRTLYRDIARYNVVRNNAFSFNQTAIRVRDSFNHIEGNTFMGKSWNDLTDPDNGPGKPVKKEFAQHDVIVDAELLDLIGEPAIGITVVNNVTLTETSTVGKNFVKHFVLAGEHPVEPVGAPTLLLENNVDRYYQCVPDSVARGNRCNPLPTQIRDGAGKVKEPSKEPLNRCEVTQIPDGCPSRDEMTQLPGVPGTWLATLYGANVLPDVCEERAVAIWKYCKEELPTAVFEIKTAAVVDGYYDESRKWSCAAPDCQTSAR